MTACGIPSNLWPMFGDNLIVARSRSGFLQNRSGLGLLAASCEKLLSVAEFFSSTQNFGFCVVQFLLTTVTEQSGGMDPHNNTFAQILIPCPATRPPSDVDL